MRIYADDGTFTGGPRDVILVLRNIETRRYHVAFYEEKPFPGHALLRTGDQPTGIRLRSALSHTVGAETLEELEQHIVDLIAKIHLPEANVWRKPEQHIDFNGEIPAILLVQDWT